MENQEKFYVIYKITNLLNGMIYIGKHITKNLEDEYMGSSSWLSKTIKKYGIENFKKEILFIFDNINDMNKKEEELVNEEFVSRNDTYNLNTGGTGSWYACNSKGLNNKSGQCYISSIKIKESEEYKMIFSNKIKAGLKKFHESHPNFWKGERNPNFGKPRPDYVRKRISECQAGSGNSQYNTMWITNELERKNKKIKKTDKIPEGWKKGRIFYK